MIGTGWMDHKVGEKLTGHQLKGQKSNKWHSAMPDTGTNT